MHDSTDQIKQFESVVFLTFAIAFLFANHCGVSNQDEPSGTGK